MPLKGVNLKRQSGQDPMQRSTFRSAFFQPEGAVGAFILEGVIADINLRNWTVDVISKYDQRYFLNVQVGSPYLHYNNGEGIFIMPDIGAKCHVCIPSDGPPPFVLDFIMPMETISMGGDDPTGTKGNLGAGAIADTDATFAGGRPKAKPGDIYIKNRDGSFIVLHRGGVLQIGATELAQRIYIPLQNLVTDVSQNYRHHNTGGSMNWFVNFGESEEDPPTVWRHSFRLRANEEKATVRIAIGKLSGTLTETQEVLNSDLNQLSIGTAPLVVEVIVSPEGIEADNGDLNQTTLQKTVLRYFFDKTGNVLFRTKGSIHLRCEKKMRIRVDQEFDLLGKSNFRIEFEGTGRIQAGALLDISASVIKFNGGSKPIATVGSQITVALPPGLTMSMIVPPATSPVIATIVAAPITTGMVTTGNPTLLG